MGWTITGRRMDSAISFSPTLHCVQHWARCRPSVQLTYPCSTKRTELIHMHTEQPWHLAVCTSCKRSDQETHHQHACHANPKQMPLVRHGATGSAAHASAR
ncbi:hypothetical protein PYCCODRAFT_1252204 [Trametes coccinea BRFM310]|uniref:Uncharacterized protein n=1 Tax=Trametes coccinea (strain BRFM310) TaxID=1353009 RepID=A0A1Y2I6H0_TRAC3|nr:hypothetical protein PYCCODRAFT_1252204 [Trametes coccinea BRFM310]